MASDNQKKLDHFRWEYLVKIIMKTLEWWVILMKCFEHHMILDDENVEAWALALLQKPMVGFRCDTIPILPYNHNTRKLGRAWLETYIP